MNCEEKKEEIFEEKKTDAEWMSKWVHSFLKVAYKEKFTTEPMDIAPDKNYYNAIQDMIKTTSCLEKNNWQLDIFESRRRLMGMIFAYLAKKAGYEYFDQKSGLHEKKTMKEVIEVIDSFHEENSLI